MIAARQEKIVAHFRDRVNELLRTGHDAGSATSEQTASAGTSGDEQALLDALWATYRQALHPTEFVTRHIRRPDEAFEQSYELLRLTFQPAELGPREGYARRLAEQAKAAPVQEKAPFVMIGRFWRVLGPQRYDAAGRLVRFGFDPLMATEQIASVIDGNYMTMLPPAGPGIGMGGIGHLATREALRRTGGHGGTLVAAFEREIAALAAARGETTGLIVLEAETDAMAFWARQGYRWPVGARYVQPPLDFDPATGERIYDEVPELLMVKNPGDPTATSVDAQLLRQAVRTLYEHWFVGYVRAFSPAAAARAEQDVWDLYAAFEASLPAGEATVPLGDPPDAIPPLHPAE